MEKKKIKEGNQIDESSCFLVRRAISNSFRATINAISGSTAVTTFSKQQRLIHFIHSSPISH